VLPTEGSPFGLTDERPADADELIRLRNQLDGDPQAAHLYVMRHS
jgi:hypothetical protein